MKVILIQPPSYETATIGPPLGLGYLGSVLNEEGHKVKIIDSIISNYNINDVQKEIKKFDPDIVGITAVTPCIKKIYSILEYAKKNNPNCKTIMGGAHPTVMAKETLRDNPYLDTIVRGEGEITFKELLDIKKKKEIFSVKGISFKLNDRLYENSDRKFIENLDKLPYPSHNLLSLNKYRINDSLKDFGLVGKTGKLYSTVSTSRGCPFGCIFCTSTQIWGKKWRGRSPENIINELKILIYKYKIKEIDFLEDTFTLNKRRTEKICKLIKEEGLDFSWICTTRVDLFDRHIALSLKKSGCHLICFGIESSSQVTLDFLQKGFVISDIKKAVKIAKDVGLNVIGSFILGSPYETKNMINNTISFAKKLNLHSARFPLLVPFPGTKIYKMAEKENKILTKDWNKYRWDVPILKSSFCSQRQLRWYQFKAGFVCHFRPSVFINRIKNIL